MCAGSVTARRPECDARRRLRSARASLRGHRRTRRLVPLDALGLALAAAVLHAGWNVLLRGARDVEAATAATLALSVILFAPVAAATWNVRAAAWPYVAASAV